MELLNSSRNFSTSDAGTATTTTDFFINGTDDTHSSTVLPPVRVFRTLSDELVFQQGVTTAFTIAYGVVMVPAILGNLFILLTIACHPELRSQHTNIYVINLAVCDFMVVVAECPFVIIQFLIRGETSFAFFTDSVCRLTFFINGFFGTCSILTMLAIGVERYCAVMHPLQALGENTTTRARSIVFFFWSFTILTHLGQLAIFGEVKTMYYINHVGESFDVTICMSARPEKQPVYSHIYACTVFILIYGSTFCTTLVLYVRILQHLLKRKHVSPDQILETASKLPIRRVRNKPVVPKTCTKAVQKTFRMLSCSILSYLVCYSLYFYLNLYFIYYGLTKRSGMALILIANWFGALNSLINPIVYAVFVDQFRTAFMGILTGTSWRKSRTSSRIPIVTAGSRARRRPTPKPKTKSKRVKPRIATIGGESTTTDRP